jgi:hypothetical protein
MRVAEAMAAFGAEVEDLTREPVATRRQGRQWTLKVRVRGARWLAGEGFGFSGRTLRLGRRTVTLGDDTLQIAQVAVEDNMLSLIVRQTSDPVADAARGEQQADTGPADTGPADTGPADTVAADAALADGALADAALADAARLLRAVGHDPLRLVFARRALRGIGQLAADATPETIAAAAGSATDTEVVVRALEQPEALSLLSASDPLAAAKIRGLRAREQLLHAEGGTWDAKEAAEHLHLTRQGVNRRRRMGTLLALDVGRLGYRYPAWQFTRAGTLRGWEGTLAALGEHDPWMQLSFMLGANPRLDGETPLAALRAGRHQDVEAAAQAFGDHGAA